MTHPQNLKILAFVGLTGSGKSTAVEYFTHKGYPRVYGGGVIYSAMAEAGIEKGEENEKTFRIEIREREGQDFVVNRIITQINDLVNAGQHRIIADGIYSWDEYKAMKHAFPGHVSIVAVTAPKHKRYHWLETREDRPQSPQISEERDHNEIETIQKGGPIAAADFFIANSGSREHFFKQLDELAEETGFLA
jgi:dephospho-CoA kinase